MSVTEKDIRVPTQVSNSSPLNRTVIQCSGGPASTTEPQQHAKTQGVVAALQAAFQFLAVDSLQSR